MEVNPQELLRACGLERCLGPNRPTSAGESNLIKGNQKQKGSKWIKPYFWESTLNPKKQLENDPFYPGHTNLPIDAGGAKAHGPLSDRVSQPWYQDLRPACMQIRCTSRRKKMVCQMGCFPKSWSPKNCRVSFPFPLPKGVELTILRTPQTAPKLSDLRASFIRLF